MKTWDKTNSYTYTSTGNVIIVDLPPSWEELYVAMELRSSNTDYIVDAVIYPGQYYNRYRPGLYRNLGIAGNFGTLYKWLAPTKLQFHATNGNGAPTSGNFTWSITVKGS